MTMSSELTTPGRASLVDDNEEHGLVLDQATLVLGDEDPNEEDVLEANDPHDPQGTATSAATQCEALEESAMH